MSNTYKDGLFRSLFNNKKSILSLYNAIYGTDYDETTEVTINTLAETLFTNQKNDVSAFIESNLVIIYEHQATAQRYALSLGVSYSETPYEFVIMNTLAYQKCLEFAQAQRTALSRKLLSSSRFAA
jgi:hypothetical protein